VGLTPTRGKRTKAEKNEQSSYWIGYVEISRIVNIKASTCRRLLPFLNRFANHRKHANLLETPMDHLALITIWLAFATCVVLGLLGAVVPAIPGTPLIFAGIALVAWWYDFTTIGIPTLVITGILAVLALIVDIVAGVLGARRVGASRHAIVGATIGSLVGIVFGLPGIILGPFVGAILGELLAEQSMSRATKVGVGTWIGILVGTAAKIALSLAMVGVFFISFLSS